MEAALPSRPKGRDTLARNLMDKPKNILTYWPTSGTPLFNLILICNSSIRDSSRSLEGNFYFGKC